MKANLRIVPIRFAFVGILILLFSNASFAEDYTFRKTKWGMSIAEVKSAEPLEMAKEDELLLGYKTNVIGKDVLLIYFFIDNQLVRARYVLAELSWFSGNWNFAVFYKSIYP